MLDHLYKLRVTDKNYRIDMHYESLDAWCKDHGYVRRFATVYWHNETDYHIDQGEDHMYLYTGNKDIIRAIQPIWIDDEDKWIVRPKFRYYNKPINITKEGNFTKYCLQEGFIDRLDNTFGGREEYHIYYRGYTRYLSLKSAGDETLYKLMFL